MRILGINYLSESSVCLLENGKLKYAISEERINRYGSPLKSIKECLDHFNLKLKDIDYISSHGTSSFNKKFNNEDEYFQKTKEISNSDLKKKDKKFLIKKIDFRKKKEKKAYVRNRVLLKGLEKKLGKSIEVFDHHKCHAASAAYFSSWKKCIVLTADGYGDESSSKLYLFEKSKLTEIKSTSILNSLGYFYGSITDYLGFKPHRHEGKVLGLAAYGNKKKAYSVISKLIYYDKKIKNIRSNFKNGYLPLFKNEYLKKLLKNFSKKDIAAATQKVLEKVILDYLNDLNFKNYKLVLAGGIFANVKLNQKISELKQVKDLFIFPNMGDGGLCVGAAALTFKNHSKKEVEKIKDMYLGKKFSNSDVKKEIKKFKIKKFKKDIKPAEIADLLHKGKIIALFNGRMEFGPRALCNRSIICKATNSKINNSLNKKLQRTEFMPFAPITLETHKSKMFYNSKKGDLASKFMTLTYRCKKKMIKISPATVHVDNTARPQFINKKQNPKIYGILNEYFRISKIPNLINTSFNMHEEPIVYTPNDALRSFLQSKIDYLYIEDFLIPQK